MTYYVGNMPAGDHLMHYGTKGMKWGRRRYQNPDGSLTAAGRARYGNYMSRASRASGMAAANRRAAGQSRSRLMKSIYGVNERYYTGRANKLTAKANRVKRTKSANNSANRRKTLRKVGIAVGAGAAAAGATYLGMRYGKSAVRAAKRLGRAAPFKARAVGNKARTMYAKGVVNARHAGRNIKTGFGNVTRKAGARASALKANNKLARSSANAYRKYGVIGSNLRRGDKAFIDAGKYAKRASSNLASKARKTAIKTGFKANALGYKAKATYAKGVVGAKGAARKAGAAAKKAASQAKFDAGRKLTAAGYKAKTAKAKAVVGAKNTARKAKSGVKNAIADAKTRRAARNSDKGYKKIQKNLNKMQQRNKSVSEYAKKVSDRVERFDKQLKNRVAKANERMVKRETKRFNKRMKAWNNGGKAAAKRKAVTYIKHRPR